MAELTRMQRLRLRKRLLKDKTHSDLSRQLMAAIGEYLGEAAPDQVPIVTVMELRVACDLLLRHKAAQIGLDERDLQEMEDDVLRYLDEDAPGH